MVRLLEEDAIAKDPASLARAARAEDSAVKNVAMMLAVTSHPGSSRILW